jgi:hypothetical protein
MSSRGEHQHRHRDRGERANENGEFGGVHGLFGRLGDDVLEPDAGHGDAEIQRQVGVAPDLEAYRITA